MLPTIYSFKWDKDKNGNRLETGHKIETLDLLDSYDKIKNYFIEPNPKKENDKPKELWKNLLIYNEDRKLYDSLKTIFDQYNNNKENPFILFMKDKYQIDNPKWVQINNQKISKLRFIGKDKNIKNCLILKNHSNNAILESFNATSIRVYRDNKGKLITIPMNVKTIIVSSGKLIVDDNKFNKVLIDNNISKNEYFEINTGTVFKRLSDSKLFYSNGGGDFKYNKIEIKSLQQIMKK